MVMMVFGPPIDQMWTQKLLKFGVELFSLQYGQVEISREQNGGRDWRENTYSGYLFGELVVFFDKFCISVPLLLLSVRLTVVPD